MGGSGCNGGLRLCTQYRRYITEGPSVLWAYPVGKGQLSGLLQASHYQIAQSRLISLMLSQICGSEGPQRRTLPRREPRELATAEQALSLFPAWRSS